MNLTGGATVWPYAGVSVFPKKGDATVWYNLLRSSDLDLFSIHKGCPVILGGKWIGNKWISVNGQWDGIDSKCGLDKSAWYLPPKA